MQKSVIEYLKNTVAKYPNKTAVQDAEGSITFQELWFRACRIASAIGESKNSPIGVYLPKSCKMVEAFSGISMSGNFYVPLDIKSPTGRVMTILNTLEAHCVITDQAHVQTLNSIFAGKVLIIDDIVCDMEDSFDFEDSLHNQIDTDPVYSIFTSGSTGAPKGVVIAHRGVIDYIDWAKETFQIDSTSVIGNQAPFYFDNSESLYYIFLSLPLVQ